MIKPLIVSHSDKGGGAARAAYRLQSALVRHGVESRMRVASKLSDDWRVEGPVGKLSKSWGLLRAMLGQLPTRLQRTENSILHSPAAIPSNLAKDLNRSAADLINLHWVSRDMVSIEDIGRINKPMVWTLHDSWAFCGSEHYPHGLDDDRYVKGYTPQSRDVRHSGADLDAWVWRRKRKAWTQPFVVVTPSQWLADCAHRSALMHDWPITAIPNALPTDVYQPWPRSLARSMFGLPHHTPIILFGAMGGTSDPRKGWDLLQSALQRVAHALPKCQAVVFGQSEPTHPPQLGMPIRYVGHLHDDPSLAMLYSASDVMIVPSRLENLPQAATEAQACGIPVVGFDCGGMPDVVAHRTSGYLARPYSIDDLAAGIVWVLESEARHKNLSQVARERATSLWAPNIVARKYEKAYCEAIELWQLQKTCKPYSI
jgi:glycosyltransferase involved in cell wall biosynthesis